MLSLKLPRPQHDDSEIDGVTLKLWKPSDRQSSDATRARIDHVGPENDLLDLGGIRHWS